MSNADAPAAPVTDTDALFAELTKWRERVPRLAQALKERTDRIAELEAQLNGEAAAPAPAAQAGDGARQQLIDDLELARRKLKERCHAAEAKVHAQANELEEMEGEVRSWRERWQQATVDLDQSGEQRSALEGQLAELEAARHGLEDDCDALRAEGERLTAALAAEQAGKEEVEARCVGLEQRNEQLFETTEFANRQIEALSTSVEQQTETLRQQREQLTVAEQALEQHREQLAAAERALVEQREAAAAIQSSLEQETEQQRELLQRHADRLVEAQAQLDVAKAEKAEQAALQLALEAAADADAATAEAQREQIEEGEREQRRLADELETQAAAKAVLEEELSAAQNQLVELERAKAAQGEELVALQQTRDELCAAKASLAEELEGLRSELTTTQVTLRQRDDALERSGAQRDALYARIEALQTAETSQRESLADSEAQRLALATELHQLEHGWQATQIQLLDDITSLKQQLEKRELAAESLEQNAQNHGTVAALLVEALEAAAVSTEQTLELERSTRPVIDERLPEQLAASLQRELEAVQACELLTDRIASLEAAEANSVQSVADAKDLQDEASQALVCAQQAQAELEAERSALKDRVAELERACEAYEADRANAAAQRFERELAEARIQTLEEQLETLQAQEAESLASTTVGEAGEAANDESTKEQGSNSEIKGPEETVAELSGAHADQMLLILNQQLSDARAENERLQARLAAVSGE